MLRDAREQPRAWTPLVQHDDGGHALPLVSPLPVTAPALWLSSPGSSIA
jgi:hypothetical protein